MSPDFIKLAATIFEGTRRQALNADIKNLASNMKILENNSMCKLNRRFSEGGWKIWDTFAEHNFAVKLALYHNQNAHISCDPDEDSQHPPNFKIVKGKLTYWIQMKQLFNLKRENRQKKIIKKIKEEAKKIAVRAFFGCGLYEQFFEKDISDFIDFLYVNSSNFEKGKEYIFPNEETPKAIVDFWYPNKSDISSLTMGISGDMDMVQVTGHTKNQIKQGLINAAGGFEWNVDDYVINLIAIDADNYEDVDICDAVFGTEFEVFGTNKHTWSRKDDGFFLVQDFSKKIAGVIALKSKGGGIVSDYFGILYVNEIFKDRINDFNMLLNFSDVIYHNMRPPIGKGNFWEKETLILADL